VVGSDQFLADTLLSTQHSALSHRVAAKLISLS
jgi:hypothetical protein